MSRLESDERGIVTSCEMCGARNRIAYNHLAGTVRCGSCKRSISAPSAPLEVGNTVDFDRLVRGAPIPIVVDYWAPWCRPCRLVAPELAKVAARNVGQLVVVKVNTDVLSDLGQRHGIRSIPTLAVFVGGREVARTAGARPADDIEAFVRRASGAR